MRFIVEPELTLTHVAYQVTEVCKGRAHVHKTPAPGGLGVRVLNHSSYCSLSSHHDHQQDTLNLTCVSVRLSSICQLGS